MKSWVFIGVGVVVAVTIAYFAYTSGTLTPGAVTQMSVSSEISRLASLASDGSIRTDDLATLRGLIEDNRAAEHEFEGLEFLVEHGEHGHAVHSLAFIETIVATGMGIACPEHEVAHYYVFAKYGEEELAEHSLHEAEEQIEEWEPKAREFSERYNTGISFDDRLAELNERIEQIESGSYNVTDEEVLAYSDRAICVEGGLDVGDE
jgi:hypothetical protein